ncbi:putative ferric reductase like transmembrane component [Phaeomoniella chlamydospora]|uniref:Putative ferric reductase like transmembrane component n=1 Tax=Phaeomoniella chlamydospora TaxID=158046 RepID=A0A0G2EDK3_PHACM|nr:putative ferric reductase like transmembrane component [Phaeomoniella chlamydospora]
MASFWPYQFVSLSAEQVEARRKILDRNGYYAYLTPIVVLAVLAVYQQLLKRQRSRIVTSKHDPTHEPALVIAQLRRMKWWLSEPLNPEFGSRRVHLLGFIYAAWLLFLSGRQTSNDYLHFTKQLGHIAVTQLPLHYLLAIKSPLSPVQVITGLTYETILPYHRLFGRIIHVFFLAHAALYLNFFSQANLLSKRLGDRDVRLGLLSIVMIDILAITSIPPIRKFAYHTAFYRTHILISVAIVPALFFHVPYTRFYVLQCFLFAAGNATTRKAMTSQPILSTVKSAGEGTNLVKLIIPGPSWGLTPFIGSKFSTWTPGQHVYIKQSMSPKLPRSPFTIVSLPPTSDRDTDDETESGKIELVLRNLNGPMTGWLAKKPLETGRTSRNVEILFEGPYGESSKYVPDLIGQDSSDVLLIAGGVGATFTLPIYVALLQGIAKRKQNPSSPTVTTKNGSIVPLARERKIIFTWIVRTQAESQWGIETLNRYKLSNLSLEIDARIYITSSSPSTSSTFSTPPSIDISSAKSTSFLPLNKIPISQDFPAPGISVTNSLNHLHNPPSSTSSSNPSPSSTLTPPSSKSTSPTPHPLHQLHLPSQPPPSPPSTPQPQNPTSSSSPAPPSPSYLTIQTLPSQRPNIPLLIHDFMTPSKWSRKEILVCGPPALKAEVRKQVGGFVYAEGRDVGIWEESFGHG